jgi:hypothetical protein
MTAIIERTLRHTVQLGSTLAVLLGASAASAQETSAAGAAPVVVVAPQATVTLAGPPVLSDWSEGDSIPVGYHVHKKVRTGFIVSGAVTFGLSYALAVFGGVIGTVANCGGDGTCVGGERRVNYGAMYIPGIGPFIELGQAGRTAGGAVFSVLDGAAQLGGIALLSYGIAARKTVLQRDGASTGLSVSVSPIVGSGRTGMGFVGTF